MEEWKQDKGKTAKVREKAKQAIFETKHVAKNSTHNCLTERYHPRISTSSFDSCHLLILNSGDWRHTPARTHSISGLKLYEHYDVYQMNSVKRKYRTFIDRS